MKVNNDYRITIPAELRKKCNIKPGDHVNATLIEGRLVISKHKLSTKVIEKLTALLQTNEKGDT